MGTSAPQLNSQEAALALLRTATGSQETVFRPHQWDAITGLLRRERLLLVQRTGWGKSIVYFLATRLLREQGAGCTLLISPLLALMRNQIEAARRIGVRAMTVNSANIDDWPEIWRALNEKRVDVLLISPERLANDEFLTQRLLPIAQHVGLLVVDEAHCISDWGHDFRPDYRRIVRILRALPPNVPVLATTATANDRVVADIEQQLGPKLRTVRGPLTRDSLALQNLVIPSKAARLAWMAEQVPRMPGSGIIYTLTKRDAELLAAWLQSRGMRAPAYHAGLEKNHREALEDQLLRNEVKALVATVALSMGFDKPDLGFVVHFQRPSSVVAYYQQVGRAGRALPKAYGILLHGAEDDEIADYFMRMAFPAEEEVDQVLGALRSSSEPLKLNPLLQRVNISKAKLDAVLKFLQVESPSPIQKTEDGYVLNPVRWKMPLSRIARITDLRRSEQAKMDAYIATAGCLMQFLARELNDPAAHVCGRCANCRKKGFPAEVTPALAEAAAQFIDRFALEIHPRVMWPAGMSFEGMKGRIPPQLQLQPGRALCRWGDTGLAEMVRAGKKATGVFPDRLVDAAARLILDQWKPKPTPQWLTCAPSRRHPRLLPDFAARLAIALNLPFVDCIQSVRIIEEQKRRHNTAKQVQNLERAFAINKTVRRGPVLLVDDMVDSRWTLTVLAAKLQQAGSGPVFPFALADSSQESRET